MADETADMKGPTKVSVEQIKDDVKDYTFNNVTGTFEKNIKIKCKVPSGEKWKVFVRIVVDKEEE